MNESALLKELQKLPNVGPSVARDLILIGVKDPKDLAKMNPDEMYIRLCRETRSKQDPCVWDVFAALVALAKGGPKKPWYHFTPERKRRWGIRNPLDEISIF
jgi:hypothetical protein